MYIKIIFCMFIKLSFYNSFFLARNRSCSLAVAEPPPPLTALYNSLMMSTAIMLCRQRTYVGITTNDVFG